MRISFTTPVACAVLAGLLIACGGEKAAGGGGTATTATTSTTSSTGTTGFNDIPKKTQINGGAADAQVNGNATVSGVIEYQADNGQFQPLEGVEVSVSGGLSGSATSDASGSFSLDAPVGSTPPGAKNATLQFSGSQGYSPSSKALVFNVTKAMVSLSGITDYTVRHSQRFDLGVNAEDDFGNPVSVPVAVAGPLTSSGTSNGGFANFNLDSTVLSPGVYTLVVSSPGNAYYESSSGFNASVTVQLGVPSLTAANFSATRGTTKHYKIRVLDEQSRPIFGIACGLDILDGPNYSATTNSDGYATFTIVLDTDWRTGGHDCKVSTSANSDFKATAKTIQMTVN